MGRGQAHIRLESSQEAWTCGQAQGVRLHASKAVLLEAAVFKGLVVLHGGVGAVSGGVCDVTHAQEGSQELSS